MKNKNVHTTNINPITISNIILLSIAVLLFSFYIIQANMIASGKYEIKVMNERLASLNESVSLLSVQRSQVQDPSELIVFAKSRNMVEAKNVTYLFENGNVALQR